MFHKGKTAGKQGPPHAKDHQCSDAGGATKFNTAHAPPASEPGMREPNERASGDPRSKSTYSGRSVRSPPSQEANGADVESLALISLFVMQDMELQDPKVLSTRSCKRSTVFARPSTPIQIQIQIKFESLQKRLVAKCEHCSALHIDMHASELLNSWSL